LGCQQAGCKQQTVAGQKESKNYARLKENDGEYAKVAESFYQIGGV
jgi:hypothetical protein